MTISPDHTGPDHTGPDHTAPDHTDEFSGRTFEELVTELERVASAMDRGDIGIEEAADLYERAAALHAVATERLVGVQRRLSELRGLRQ